MIISSKKYACETCIKGHRSSACKHTDRPLFEIKKKGRPVTQCEHCRELRKTKQVHVKCICESKFESTQLGPKPGFESAAFPTGLPPALGASVAFPNSADGGSSDSDPGGVHHGHRCKSGDPCNCVKPRTRIRASDDSVPSSSRRAGGGHPSSSNGLIPAAHILERIHALRPIVPRPPSQGPYPIGGPLHNPSLGTPHGHGSRHHEGYAPYGSRHGMSPHSNAPPQSYGALPASSDPAFSFNGQQAYNDPFQMGSWGSGPENGGMDSLSLPSVCGCGDDCSCPGCIHHSRVAAIPSSSAYSSCNNPSHCGTCLDCTIMALPPSALLPPNTALSIYDSSAAIDDWLRTTSASNQTDQSAFQQDFLQFQQQQHPSWNNRAYPFPDPAGPNVGFGSYNPMMPFNPSNERGGGGTGGPLSHSRQRSSDDINIDPRLLPPPSSRSKGGRGTPFLALPNTDDYARSRSPSTSSQSSHHGHASDGGGGGVVPPYRPSGRVQGMGLYEQQHGVRQQQQQQHGGRSPPQLNLSVRRGPSSGSSSTSGLSPSPGSAGSMGSGHAGTRAPYANGNGSSPPGSAHVDSSGYVSSSSGGDSGPSLAGLHIY